MFSSEYQFMSYAELSAVCAEWSQSSSPLSNTVTDFSLTTTEQTFDVTKLGGIRRHPTQCVIRGYAVCVHTRTL